MARHSRNLLLTATIFASFSLAGLAQAGPNSPNISPSMGGMSSVRPDFSIRGSNALRNSDSVNPRGVIAPPETKKKKVNKKSRPGSIEDKVLGKLQPLQKKKKDAIGAGGGSLATPSTKGSPQPDPPNRIEPTASGGPGEGAAGASVPAINANTSPSGAIPAAAGVIPSDLIQRLQDRANAQTIREIEALLESAGVGLPGRQAGRPGETTPPLASGLPGSVPEPNATGPGPNQRPNAEDILAGRGFGSSRDDKYDIAHGYPGAAGGALRDPRGQASSEAGEGKTTSFELPGPNEGEKETVELSHAPNGDLVITSRTTRSDGSSITMRKLYAPEGDNGWRSTPHQVTTQIERANGTWALRIEHYNRAGERTGSQDVSNRGYLRTVIGLGQPDQPAPTDDYRTGGKDNCNWVPGVGCTARMVSPRDMTGQPGRGERSETPVAKLPDSGQVTNPNPVDGSEGPVGLRAPVNPRGGSSPDPTPGDPDNPSPR